MAKSYNDAVERIISKYSTQFDDDDLLDYDDWELFRDEMNSKYSIALSDIEIYEEI